MTIDTVQKSKPRRRWFRFRLRTLLILMAVLSVPLSWVGWELAQARKDRAVLDWVDKSGGSFRTHQGWLREIVWEVNLAGTQVTNLSPLARLDQLEVIYLYNTQVSDLSPLAELKKLWCIELNDSQVDDLSPLADLEGVRWLYLDNTAVSDLSPLSKLKQLEELTFSGTQVIDVSLLKDFKKLRLLRLFETQVSEEQLQKLRQALPNCEIPGT